MKNESPQRVDEVSRQRAYGERFDDAASRAPHEQTQMPQSSSEPEIGKDGLLASSKDERSPNIPGHANSDHGPAPKQAEAKSATHSTELLNDAYSVNDPGVTTKD